MGNDQPLQLVGAGYRLFPNAMVFHMIPDLFVGVEFRGVWWKAKKL